MSLYLDFVDARVANEIKIVLQKLPEEIRNFVRKKIYFMDVDNAFLKGHLAGEEKGKGKKHFIFFNEKRLTFRSTKQIRFTILHEIGHAWYNHKTRDSNREFLWFYLQEKQANDFAKKIMAGATQA